MGRLGRRPWPLSAKFTILIVVVSVASFGLYAAWVGQAEREAIETRALSEARVLSHEMAAVWDYVNDNQSKINYNSDGTYDFKGIYCTLTGKDIAARFMEGMDFGIRYARENPRTGTDAPDGFEQAAISAFERSDADEFWRVEEVQGRQSFRYASVLRAEGVCLSCHGEPAGEFDELGFIKEGYREGDVAGVASITIPLGVYESDSAARRLRDTLFFLGLMTVVILLSLVVLRRWVVRPVGQLNQAAAALAQGDLTYPVAQQRGSRELAELSAEFGAMAAELDASYSHLEEEVAQRTRDLACANERLQQDNRFKDNVLSVVSHELKTPLATMGARLDIWQRRAQNESEETKRLVADVRKSAEELLATVQNTVDMARFDEGRFTLNREEADMVDVVAGVLGQLEPLAQERGVTLSSQISEDVPVVEADCDVLGKVLVNLVGNGIKFAGAGGSVNVAVGTPQPGWVQLRVEDTGCGIAPEHLEHVFERFYQVDQSASREQGGSGLGLALVKVFAEALGGWVQAESELGLGSAFTFTFPAQAVQDGGEAEEVRR